jgi:hypothetical protein
VEKADKIDLLKLYPQFVKAVDRDTMPQSMPCLDCQPDKFEKTTTIPMPAQNSNDAFEKTPHTMNDLTCVQNPFADINNVRAVFKDFINTANDLQTQVNELDHKIIDKKDTTKAVFAALSPIIPFRRITSVPDKIVDKDYWGTAGAITVAGFLLPEDLRDTRDGARQVLYKILPRNLKLYIAKKNKDFYKKFILYRAKYDHKKFQTPFSFIRGSYLEKIVNKIGGKVGYYLHEWDKPLLNTNIGKKVKKWLNVKITDKEFTGRLVPKILKDEQTGKYIEQDVKVFAYKLEGSYIGKLICRAMQRTTVYGTLALAAITVPSILKAIKKSKNTEDKVKNSGKQISKTIISITSTVVGIGLGGALLAPIGPAGSVLGMAIGSGIAAYFSSKINKNIS